MFSVHDPSANSFIWNFGDGNKGAGNPVTHSYTLPGTYTVSLNYIGGIDPGPVKEVQSVSVAPLIGKILNISLNLSTSDPSVRAGFTVSPASPKVASPVTFSAAATTDPTGIINIWRWDFGDGSTGTGKTVVHQYKAGGDYRITLAIYRSGDTIEQIPEKNYGTATRTVHIGTSIAPRAVFSFLPPAPDAGETVYFDASNSSDPDGNISAYRWNFGDGIPRSGRRVAYIFPGPGEKDVVLTVTDNDGNTGSRTGQITVFPPVRPSVNIAVDTESPRQEQPVVFEAVNIEDPKGLIDRFTWDFGDGTTGSGQRITHAFAKDGSYTVNLVISASKIQELRMASFYSASASRQLQVLPFDLPVPEFTVTPYHPVERAIVSFDASASTSNGGEIISYTWDLGDGTVRYGARTSHTYATPASYLVTLTVTDIRGHTNTSRKNVPVAAGFDIVPWILPAVLIPLGGYLGYRHYRIIQARKNRPKLPSSISWQGGVEMKDKPPGYIRVDVKFSGGVEDHQRK